MRKKRAFIFDDDPMILAMLTELLRGMDYETISHAEPVACPLYADHERCDNLRPCCDVLLTDLGLRGMSGLDMILLQQKRGCKRTIKNKAVMSGNIDQKSLTIMIEKGIPYFQKPFRLSDFRNWLKECESRIDLSQPLGIKRTNTRSMVDIDVSFHINEQIDAVNGHVANISNDGINLLTDHELKEDQTITFRTPLPNSCTEAQVRWVSRESGPSFSAGLRCVTYGTI